MRLFGCDVAPTRGVELLLAELEAEAEEKEEAEEEGYKEDSDE